MKKSLVAALLLAVIPLSAQGPQGDTVDLAKANQPDTLKVLSVGNSYTFMWDVPGQLQAMAAQGPRKKKLYVHGLTWGGQTLNFYWKSRLRQRGNTARRDALGRGLASAMRKRRSGGNRPKLRRSDPFQESRHENPSIRMGRCWQNGRGGEGTGADPGSAPESR